MYSVVLLVALTGSGDQPAGLFSHGCCGGGCSGACYGGCCGGKHHGGGGHGCCGGKHHGGGCCGGCYGCCGGGHHGCRGGKHHGGGCCGGCYGGCYGGCCGGYGGCCGGWGGCTGYGCTGAGCMGAGCVGGCVGAGCVGGGLTPSMPVVPGTPVVPDTGKDGKTKTEMTVPAPATIVVSLPADARLLIDDAATTSTSDRRVFVSPSLNPGREYHYTLKAEWTVDGKTMAAVKEIAVRAGNETRVNFEAATLPAVASR